MEALDGNAIAGDLEELFGREMTGADGVCVHCGVHSLVAELRVYSRAPGTVARCPACGDVVFVIVFVREGARIELASFALSNPAG